MQINHLQAQTLIEILQDNIDGESVYFLLRGDGTLHVAFTLNTVVIDRDGNVEEN